MGIETNDFDDIDHCVLIIGHHNADLELLKMYLTSELSDKLKMICILTEDDDISEIEKAFTNGDTYAVNGLADAIEKIKAEFRWIL